MSASEGAFDYLTFYIWIGSVVKEKWTLGINALIVPKL